MRHPLLALAAAVALAGACAEDPVGIVENQPPVARIVASSIAAVGAVLNLDGSSSTDPDGTIATFAWDFGDGTTGTGATASHIYNAAGTFTITLTVEDDGGASAEDTLIVVVDDNQAPTAAIVAEATGGVGAAVRFDGSTSSDADGTITSFAWNFGDGATGTGPTFDKTYTTAGSYTVTLTVTDNEGATGQATHTIVIDDAPAGFDGEWSWFLTNESLRDLGLVCGSFQDSQLTIAVNGGSITITERAGSTNVVYTGTLSGNAFTATNTQITVTQTIAGTFTSSTAFTGTYSLDPGFTTCADRPVEGTKNP